MARLALHIDLRHLTVEGGMVEGAMQHSRTQCNSCTTGTNTCVTSQLGVGGTNACMWVCASSRNIPSICRSCTLSTRVRGGRRTCERTSTQVTDNCRKR